MNDYYKAEGLSNSKLTWLKDHVLLGKEIPELQPEYFRIGKEVDKLITYPGYISDDEKANEIYKGFQKNCKKSWLDFIDIANKQVACFNTIQFEGFDIYAKCLHDLLLSGISLDIKTTECKTKQQFVDACMYFEYNRQSYWYHRVSNTRKSWIIGIQKSYPHNVFFVDAERELEMLKSGKESAEYLAYVYYRLFLI